MLSVGRYGLHVLHVLKRETRLTRIEDRGTQTNSRLGGRIKALISLSGSHSWSSSSVLGHSYTARSVIPNPKAESIVTLLFIMAQIREAFSALPPRARVTPGDFVVAFQQAELDDLRSLVAASRVGPETFEGLQQDRKYGVTTQWLRDAKTSWLEDFDW